MAGVKETVGDMVAELSHEMTDASRARSAVVAEAGEESTSLVIGADGLARPAWASRDPLLREYYDAEWGQPVLDERGLFERLALESFQSGLSWRTVLAKREAFREVFLGFDPEAVAQFDEHDVERLLWDARIIRNRQKVEATIANASAVVAAREIGGLPALVWSARPASTPAPERLADVPSTSPESRALASALKRCGLRFVGPTTMFALMEAVGVVDTHLVGSHRRGASGVFAPDGRARSFDDAFGVEAGSVLSARLDALAAGLAAEDVGSRATRR